MFSDPFTIRCEFVDVDADLSISRGSIKPMLDHLWITVGALLDHCWSTVEAIVICVLSLCAAS
eukprot:2307779-Heterocapsa_arctica.AAC.1